jgi:hypothetical protein
MKNSHQISPLDFDCIVRIGSLFNNRPNRLRSACRRKYLKQKEFLILPGGEGGWNGPDGLPEIIYSSIVFKLRQHKSI